MLSIELRLPQLRGLVSVARVIKFFLLIKEPVLSCNLGRAIGVVGAQLREIIHSSVEMGGGVIVSSQSSDALTPTRLDGCPSTAVFVTGRAPT